MNEIICPHCKNAFKIDEAGFADILKQVRDHQFEKELHDRLELLEKDKENAVKLAEAKTKSELQEQISKKDAELTRLQAKLESSETEKKLELSEAVSKVEKERDSLANDLKAKILRSSFLSPPLKKSLSLSLSLKTK